MELEGHLLVQVRAPCFQRIDLISDSFGSIPFCALAVLGIFALWPDERRNRYGAAVAVSKIDFLGNLLLAVGSILLVFALQEAGSFVWSWCSPVIIWSLATAGACWAVLAVWEYYLLHRTNQRIHPIFPLSLARNRVYLFCLLYRPAPSLTQPLVRTLTHSCHSVTLLAGFVYIALVIKVPECLQIVHGDSALWAGVHLLPMLGACAFGSFLGGAVSKRANLTCQTLVAGGMLQVGGLALALGFSGGRSLGLLLGFTAVYGLGVGLCFAACTMIAAIEASNDDLAAAQGAVAQARVFGGAVGLATCTIIFNEKLRRALGSDAAQQEEGLGQVHRSLMAVLALPDDARLEAVRVYLDAFRDQMMAMTVVAVAALLLSIGTYRSSPGDVANVMVQHKELAGRARQGNRADLELSSVSSVSSVRSLVR